MRKVFALILVIGLMTSVSLAKPVQQKTRPAKKPVASKKAPAKKNAGDIFSNLLSKLPESNGVVTMNMPRFLNDVLPAIIKEISDPKAKQDIAGMEAAALIYGIDIAKAGPVVGGFRYSTSGKIEGAAIVSGFNLDPEKLDSLIKLVIPKITEKNDNADKLTHTIEDYKGKPIYVFETMGGGQNWKIGVTTLRDDQVVMGTYDYVKQVTDINSGAKLPKVSPALIQSLNGASPSALYRFAVNNPFEALKAEQISAAISKTLQSIKIIRGTIDMANDLSFSLDVLARTATNKEASDIYSQLNGLLLLGKSFINKDNPKMADLEGMLNQLKLASKLKDVTLSFNLPRPMIDELIKKSKEPKKTEETK